MSDVGLQFKGLFVLCYVKFTIGCHIQHVTQYKQDNNSAHVIQLYNQGPHVGKKNEPQSKKQKKHNNNNQQTKKKRRIGRKARRPKKQSVT